MKKFICFITTACMTLCSFSANAMMCENEVIDHFNAAISGKETYFLDIDMFPWAMEPITELAKRGIVQGTGDGMFSPSLTVSRYEYIKLITSVCGIVNETAAAPYNDVSKDHWAYAYVSSAYDAGILDIYSNVILNGAAPITREEIAYLSVMAMLKGNFIESKLSGVPVFSDTEKMSHYAPGCVATLNELGVINGRDDGTFSPKDYATRAESAKIIYNILKIVENNF